MPFKINISEKDGKTYKLELDSEAVIGKSLKETISGEELSPDLKGYKFEITGASDLAGFPSMENIEGVGLKKVLLSYGKGMRKRPKREGKKERSDYVPKGLRLRKTVRGKVISPTIVQINMKVLKEGEKKLSEIFSNQEKQPKLNRKAKRKEKTKESKPSDSEPTGIGNGEFAKPDEEPRGGVPKEGIEEAKE